MKLQHRGTDLELLAAYTWSNGFQKGINEWFNTAIRMLGVNNLDVSIFKSFKMSERAALELRLESFNALNHPQFGLPDQNVNDSTFGLITTLNAYYPAQGHTAQRNI